LAFSRKQVLQPRVLQLNLEIQQMEQMLKRLIGEDVELETQLGEGLPPILVDPGQIQQILMNLAGNARDAMPHGGRLSIRTSAVHINARDRVPALGGLEGACVKLSVRDNGSGMPPEVFSHLFEPFFTTKEAGHGTGLGLATVYGIVRQSGGGILVESLPGQGTAFDLYFPASKKSEVPAQGAPPPEAAGGQETILLVEDEAQIREVLKRSLSLKGYTVYEASQGAAALELFKKFGSSIDLIITDMIMPQMGGKELTLAIRRERPDARILFMSGYTDQHTMKNGLLTDRSFFLQKPFNISDLLAKVRDLLENRKLAA
jgi:two-component system, cell cycle sensor histidine kinase and response regulator CckA